MTYNEAVKYFGGASKMARALRIKPPSVSLWKASGEIPLVSQLKIYYISRHKLDIDKKYRDFYVIIARSARCD